MAVHVIKPGPEKQKILYLETVRTRYIRDHDRYNINKKTLLNL